MNREVHVRICEGVGVRFPRATRLRYFYFLTKKTGPPLTLPAPPLQII